ncbi:ATP-binding cassette domain-containing protein [Sphingomonas rhizophila]|nr:ATP-binding cassette domain-containing protein [Sphingomonas rhizophila]
MSALETRGLIKAFGGKVAVDRLSMTVPPYAIYGFLGANGAGKTTSLRLILGLLRPDAGGLSLFGEDVARRRSRPRVGALIESPSLYPHLTGRENLDLTRRVLGLPANEIDRVLGIAGLGHAGRQRVGGYSLGMKQRLALARALLGRPRLLILDEPTNGLDPDGIADMRTLLRRLPEMEETTLIVSSHLLGEVQEIATHVGLMHRGRLLVEDRLENVLGGDGAVAVDTADRNAAARLLESAGFVVAEEEQRLLVRGGSPSLRVQPERVAQLLVEQGQQLIHLASHRPSLEHVYHREIARAAA